MFYLVVAGLAFLSEYGCLSALVLVGIMTSCTINIAVDEAFAALQ